MPFGNDGNLEFVLLERPSDARDADVRKRVRSHVTRTQHRRARAKAETTSPKNVDAKDGTTGKTGSRWATHRQPLLPRWEQRPGSSRDSNALHAGFSASDYPFSTAGNKNRARGERDLARGEPTWMMNCNDEEMPVDVPSSTIGRSFSRGTMAFRTFALDDALNIVGVSLARLGIDVASVLGLYDLVVQSQCHDFETHYAGDFPAGSSYHAFWNLILGDAVLLTTAILITTRFMLRSRASSRHLNQNHFFVRLRGHLIHKITTVLGHPIRGTCDEMLVAVMLFACHELYYESLATYHTHMTGLIQMINVRGGMAQIGRTNPYLERMILWHDANCSHIAGCEPYCRKIEEPSVLVQPAADTDMFRLRALEATNAG